MFLSEVPQLMELYSYMGSFGVLMASFWWNRKVFLNTSLNDAPQNTKDPDAPVQGDFLLDLAIQGFLSHLFICSRTSRHSYQQIENNNSMRKLLQMSVYISFSLPLLAQFMYENTSVLTMALIALVIPVVQLTFDLYNSSYFIFLTARNAYNSSRAVVDAVGIQELVVGHWTRLQVPRVLRLFFVLRLSVHILQLLMVAATENYATPGVGTENYTAPGMASTENYTAANMASTENDTAAGMLVLGNWTYSTVALEHLLIRSCETSVSLAGMTSALSLCMHYLGIFLAFLVGSDTDEDRNMGTVSALLFFILALQTGLTGLDPDKRLVRLYRNFCLLTTAILHFIHSMVNPLLMNLATREPYSLRHARALAMCLFLLTFPVCLLVYLWSEHHVSTWLLAVTAFSVEVMIKVLISLLVYALFLIDSYRNVFWEKLDDYVYYIQSTGNTIEFIFGIFLFCNGAWIMCFESGGFIRALMMCIHVYFNIWVQAKEGWKVFMLRRTAVKKINSLPLATQEQLEEVNDVCAICYAELTSARVTRCKHLFHSVCLRKWLYLQDHCPLCHTTIYWTEGENGVQ